MLSDVVEVLKCLPEDRFMNLYIQNPTILKLFFPGRGSLNQRGNQFFRINLSKPQKVSL